MLGSSKNRHGGVRTFSPGANTRLIPTLTPSINPTFSWPLQREGTDNIDDLIGSLQTLSIHVPDKLLEFGFDGYVIEATRFGAGIGRHLQKALGNQASLAAGWPDEFGGSHKTLSIFSSPCIHSISRSKTAIKAHYCRFATVFTQTKGHPRIRFTSATQVWPFYAFRTIRIGSHLFNILNLECAIPEHLAHNKVI